MSSPRSRSAGSPITYNNNFVGRENELERTTALVLGSARLITLVGMGGIGKTRLAAEIMNRIRRAHPVPAFWVHLARLPRGADATAVRNEVVQSVVDGDFSNRSAREALIDTLRRADPAGRTQRTIVVLDNCEHVADGVAPVVDDLLRSVAGLTIVTTSREPIGWVDEYLVPIPPLSRTQAVRLFEQRAELADRPITGADPAIVASICQHVHNHPLYIQLAAARLRHRPPTAVLRELTGDATDRRLDWATSARVGSDERHHGIRNVIEWSFDLCGPRERALFERLSIFAAGYDVHPDDVPEGSRLGVGAELEAIVQVCSDPDAGLTRAEIERALERLVDHSLVSVHRGHDAVQYCLLESCRIFAQQRLREHLPDEWDRLAGRHRRYYRDKVRQALDSWPSTRGQEVLAWARGAWDNLLTAMDRSLTSPEEAAVGLEIALGLMALRIPFFHGSLRESRRLAEHALAATRSDDPQTVQLQITAMALLSWVSICQGAPEDADRLLEECVAACLPGGPGLAALKRDHTVDLGLPAVVEFAWATALKEIYSHPAAITVFGRAREKSLADGDLGTALNCELFEALSAGFLGTEDEAMAISRRHLSTVTAVGAEGARSWAELAWSLALIRNGRPGPALEVIRTALAAQVEAGDQWGALWAVQFEAWALARSIADSAGARTDRLRVRALQTAHLLGAAAAMRRRLGVDIGKLRPVAAEIGRAADIARRVLGTPAFDAAVREGEALRTDLGEVTRMALSILDRSPADHRPRSVSPNWGLLSAAEREVAVLAAAGWTNSAIAASRGNSTRTVDAQIAAVLQKLMINSRADIGAFIPAGATTTRN